MRKPELPEPKPVEQITSVEVESHVAEGGEIPAPVEVSRAGRTHQDRIVAVLSEEEREAIRKKARKQIEDEKREFAKRKLLEETIAQLREEEGVGGVEDDIVSVLIDLPTYAPWIRINGTPYFHGRTYTVARHVARTLLQQMWDAKLHDARLIKGTKLAEFYRRPHDTMLNGRGEITNAPVPR